MLGPNTRTTLLGLLMLVIFIKEGQTFDTKCSLSFNTDNRSCNSTLQSFGTFSFYCCSNMIAAMSTITGASLGYPQCVQNVTGTNGTNYSLSGEPLADPYCMTYGYATSPPVHCPITYYSFMDPSFTMKGCQATFYDPKGAAPPVPLFCCGDNVVATSPSDNTTWKCSGSYPGPFTDPLCTSCLYPSNCALSPSPPLPPPFYLSPSPPPKLFPPPYKVAIAASRTSLALSIAASGAIFVTLLMLSS